MTLIDPEFQYLSRHEDVELTNCDREAIHLISQIQENSWAFILSCQTENKKSEHAPLAVSKNINEISGLSAEEFLTSDLNDTLPQRVLSLVEAVIDNGLAEPEHLDSVSFPWQENQTFDVTLHRAGAHVIIEWCKSSEQSFSRLVVPFLEGAVNYKTVNALSEFVTSLLRNSLGSDQVNLYRFDDSYHGESIAESKIESAPSYLHNWFPASDIPVPARIVMVKRPVGFTMDNHHQGVDLVAMSDQLPEIDLSRSVFRQPSKMCSQYYTNMGVKARLVISIMHGSELWGFFSCWDYTDPRIPSLRLRRELALLSEYFIDEYTKRLYRENAMIIGAHRSKRERLLEKVSDWNELSGALLSIDDLHTTVPSDGAVLVIPGFMKSSGKTPPESFISDLVNWLDKNHRSVSVFAHRNLADVFPLAWAFRDTASGVLALRLGRKRPHYLIWFRKEILLDIPWAGKPEKPIDPLDPKQRLLPRSSFALWREQAVGYSKGWREHEVDLATTFRDEFMLVLNELANIELRNLLKRAREAESTQKILLANISHDLRTPVNGILANAQLLEDELKSDRSKDKATDILASSKILLRLLNDLIDQSRLQVGRIKLIENLTCLPDLEKELNAILRILAEPKYIKINYNWNNASNNLVNLDRDRFAQICMNLLSNAVKFSADNSQVTLQTELLKVAEEHTLKVQVIDSGRGIPKEKRESIFEAFSQVNEEDHKIAQGAGLGLSIVFGLVSLMRGTIKIDDNPSGGTIFNVEIPIGKVVPNKAGARTAAREFVAGTVSLKGHRMLIAEDNFINMRIMELYIERAECEAVYVKNGLDAINAASKEKFDLLVFDISMPKMDGDEAISKIRNSTSPNAKTPAIAVTAHADSQDIEAILEAGFTGYLCKPNTYDLFFEKASSVLLGQRTSEAKTQST